MILTIHQQQPNHNLHTLLQGPENNIGIMTTETNWEDLNKESFPPLTKLLTLSPSSPTNKLFIMT